MRSLFQKFSLVLVSSLALPVLMLSAKAYAASPLAQVADAKTEICAGLQATGGDCNADENASGANHLIQLVINVLSLVGGIAAVIMIIIGGLKYVTSQGDSSNTASAKNTVLYAIIGLVIIAVAQIIVSFTIGRTSSTLNCKTAGGATAQADPSCK